MRGLRPAFLVGTAVLMSLLATAGCKKPASPDYQDSLRIGTFNVQFLPGSDDDTTRSARIADRILVSRYHIIALNEVFDEDARDTFVSKLHGTFPHYVAYIGDDALFSQDSGLMLFSRYPSNPCPARPTAPKQMTWRPAVAVHPDTPERRSSSGSLMPRRRD